MRCSPANYFVGLSITRCQKEKTLFISQPDYIEKILIRFHMMESNPVALPFQPGCQLHNLPEYNTMTKVP